MGRAVRGEEKKQGQGVELRLHRDEESEDSDDGPEVMAEGESDVSFENFLQRQKRET